MDRETIRRVLREVLHQAIVASLQRQLRNFVGILETNVRYVDRSTDLSFDHWVSEISAEMVGVRSYLRCHFSSTTARVITDRLLGVEPPHHGADHLLSSIGELCNIAMGAVKRRFVAAFRDHYGVEPELVIATPNTYPSYDQARVHRADGGRHRVWEIDFGGHALLCEASVEVDVDMLIRDFALLEPDRHDSLIGYLSSLSSLRAAILAEDRSAPLAA
ncbi:MAG: chemotaxis protein CheX [Myxococcales bacterium FL481]|nr:MAG: chemotaxis protein CheX [Myxococcales bacterium FL481]